ncbi:tripartite-type tricarboxylate transporter receptor subunit TctC [Stella humosa]|uniref:Tripartite-type tricarboxylate transporter receptor subunit TctC n=1 Tax=Stella humosa TaxID=94 RepID=A0A3N1KP57_9PROT|nr:tripartite tricarboxylate transporter substrate binding protein [Stella humosa]ROP83503.1 tripartite-type tricarboxylate transporter receptor subunit TctC [Stella humosa]BBK33224.1 MFS transporter [Stella humosa]
MKTRHALAALAAALLAAAGPVAATGPAAAQAYPSKTIRWVVPYTPGGITDSVTRLVTQKIQASIGQNIVVENKPGANSIIGAENVAVAAPDGYSILTVIAAHAANATLYAGKLPFDAVKSFQPISLPAIAPLILTTGLTFPPKDMKELIAYAKQNPGKVAFGSSGIGAAAHLTTELLKQTAGIDMLHIPYKGTAPAVQDLIAGQIQVLVDVPSSMMPHVRGGKVRGVAMFSGKRVQGADEIPTIVESGGPAIEASTWVMFLAPAGTPPAIVQRLSEETAKALALPDVKERFAQLGIEAVGGTPEATGKFLADEIAKWAKVITTAGVKPE